MTKEERDALQSYVADVAGVCAWVTRKRGGPLPPIDFDTAILLHIDLDQEVDSSGSLELTPSDRLLETFTRLGEHVKRCPGGDPERNLLVARVCERVLGQIAEGAIST